MVRKIRAKLVLQLRAEGLTGRAIASSQAMSRKSITAVLEAADAAGIGWDDVAESSEAEVYEVLFPGRGEHQSVFAQPDWKRVHRELARVGVTLKLGLIRRAGLRYPNADLRRLDLVEERGLDRNVIAGLGTCSFIDRQQNVVFQGFTGSGKSYLGCAVAKQACQHRIQAHYIRMPDLEEAWALARDKPLGTTKFLKKYAAFTLLVIDEWLLDHPDEGMRSMLLELLERRYDTASTVFCTQYAKKTGISG